MKITLISPYKDITSYGIRILSAVLRKFMFQTRILFISDINEVITDTYDESICNQVADFCFDSDIVGISLFSCNFIKIADLTKKLKSKIDVPILWGGKHPSAKPEEALEYADMICIGEAESAIIELMDKIKNNEYYYDTKNFWFKKEGEIIKNSLRPLTSDLDSLPFPDYSLDDHYIWVSEEDKFYEMDDFLLQKYLLKDPEEGLTVYNTLISWGCPYSCTYCYTFKYLYKGQRYLRFRSVQSVVNEIEIIVKRFPFIEMIFFSDDSFFALNDSVLKNFETLYAEKIGLPFRCLTYPTDITEKKLKIAISTGLTQIQMGIQTGSAKTKKLYKRNISNDTILKVINILNASKDKIKLSYDFIIDNPYESDKDIINTLNLMVQIPKPYKVNIFSLVLYPGTKLYYDAIENKVAFQEVKQFEERNKTYFNLIFMLFNRKIPIYIIKFMISKPIRIFFGNKITGTIFFNIYSLIRQLVRGIRL